jgi:hypothetical protein
MAESANGKTRSWRQLRELTELLNRDESFLDEDDTSLDTALQRQEQQIMAKLATVDSLPEAAVSTLELKSARHFRAGLVKLGTDKIVTESIQGARSDSGPLNPEKLVIHSLSVMRELSPRYLSRFVSYIDTLFWLEQAGTDNKP